MLHLLFIFSPQYCICNVYSSLCLLAIVSTLHYAAGWTEYKNSSIGNCAFLYWAYNDKSIVNTVVALSYFYHNIAFAKKQKQFMNIFITSSTLESKSTSRISKPTVASTDTRSFSLWGKDHHQGDYPQSENDGEEERKRTFLNSFRKRAHILYQLH